jgi:hypothetical protein
VPKKGHSSLGNERVRKSRDSKQDLLTQNRI